MTKICESFAGGFARVGRTLEHAEQSVRVVMHLAQVQQEGEIWRRFGGGSDRNRALLGNKGNSMHDMQIVQCRINTGDCASR